MRLIRKIVFQTMCITMMQKSGSLNWLRNMSAGWKKNQKIKNRRDILCYLNWGISRKSVPDLRRNRGVHRKRKRWRSEEGERYGIRTIYNPKPG